MIVTLQITLLRFMSIVTTKTKRGLVTILPEKLKNETKIIGNKLSFSQFCGNWMTFTLIVVTYLANVLSASQLTLRDCN